MLGAALLLAPTPSLVVHRLDAWSPLTPEKNARGEVHDKAPSRPHPCAWPGKLQREVDSGGDQSNCMCQTCGAEFGNSDLLKLHCRHAAESDKQANLPAEHRHQDAIVQETASSSSFTTAEIEKHLETSFLEVVVLVEGTEPTTSST